jgi:hypothetical protein
VSVFFVPRYIALNIGSILTRIALEHRSLFDVIQTMALEFQSSVCFKVAFIEITFENRGVIQFVSLEVRCLVCFIGASREIAVKQRSAMSKFMSL